MVELDFRRSSVRGIGWVLKWAAAIGVLALASILFLDFAYRLVAEQALGRAATGGLRCASLSHGTPLSVNAAMCHELGPDLLRGAQVRVQFGPPAGRPSLQRQVGAVKSVTISVPATNALPDWLRALSPFFGGELKATRTTAQLTFAALTNYPVAAANISAYSTTQLSMSSRNLAISNSSSR
jgi:hypothetical protein